MKIGVLTSSRADFGIYLPLLSKMKTDSYFKLEIIAFGTHLSKYHGFTLFDIEKVGFNKIHQISSLISNDDAQSISTSYGVTTLKFADFWTHNKFDLVFCLGDRFEMSAAVQAGIPFGIKFAHIHGGETTLGAIDNIYRHQITIACKLHFTATQNFSQRVSELLGEVKNVYNVGSLSLDSIEEFNPEAKSNFYNKFNIIKDEFALVTFHPETTAIENNEIFAFEMRKALTKISAELFLVITMPNADTMGSVYRDQLYILNRECPDRILIVENFGKENYFNAMYYSKVMIGNTSSGIIEAASFRKFVVNVGDRQKGRAQSENVINTSFNSDEIIIGTQKAIELGEFNCGNIYYKSNSANAILSILKEYNDTIY